MVILDFILVMELDQHAESQLEEETFATLKPNVNIITLS